MINAIHTLIYANDAAATRDFFRKVLGLRAVDAGQGWLIFELPPAELGVHPAEPGYAGGRHELYLMCDDVKKTVASLTKKGVRFTSPIVDKGWGLLTTLALPGGGSIGLYQPRHATAVRMRKTGSAVANNKRKSSLRKGRFSARANATARRTARSSPKGASATRARGRASRPPGRR